MSNLLEVSELSRQSTLQDTTDNSIELPVTLDDKPRTRNRSNSKVYGRSTSSSPTLPQLPPRLPSPPVMNNTETTTQSLHKKQQIPPQITISNTNGQAQESFSSAASKVPSIAKIPNRTKVIFLVIATSLNETFDKKTLTVPEFPNVLKLGRPNSSQKAPNSSNGYFDSRVISREHAELYVKDGRVFIKDCNSSNGTFVNDEKLTQELELHMEDVVNLGVDIDNEKNKHQHHRKISLFIENVLTVPIEEGIDPVSLINDVVKKSKRRMMSRDSSLNSWDAALFGDINDEIQDITSGLEQDFVTGLFVNNDSNTSSNSVLSQTMKTLVSQIHMENLNNLKLSSVENFLLNYKDQITKNDQAANFSKVKKESEKAQIRAQELQIEVQSLKKTLEEKKSQVVKTQDIVSKKELEINNLKRMVTITERQTKDDKHKADTLVSNYEEEIKRLKAIIEKKVILIDELKPFKEKYTQSKIKFDLNKDMLNMASIVICVITIGYVGLWCR